MWLFLLWFGMLRDLSSKKSKVEELKLLPINISWMSGLEVTFLSNQVAVVTSVSISFLLDILTDLVILSNTNLLGNISDKHLSTRWLLEPQL